MGVYIKGMTKPKSCDVCIFSDWSNLHQTACCKILEYKPCFNDFSSEYRTRISDLCPLVEVSEPHGRLIDADKLPMRDISIEYYALNGVTEDDIDNAPTVIEAEGEHERRS